MALSIIGVVLSGCETLLDAPTYTETADATYYLVRHAEKQKGKDPSLTAAGIIRAEHLAVELDRVSLSQIYSTDYKRTQQTAAPTAIAQKLNVISYSPQDLEKFASQLKTQRGAILIVGHSNTTPDLVAFLGGEAGEPIVEVSEYDRLYVVTRKGRKIDTFLRRYNP